MKPDGTRIDTSKIEPQAVIPVSDYPEHNMIIPNRLEESLSASRTSIGRQTSVSTHTSAISGYLLFVEAAQRCNNTGLSLHCRPRDERLNDIAYLHERTEE